MRAPFAFASFAALFTFIGSLHAEEKRELDSHEHGHVTLQIAIEKNQMNIAFEAPGESIVGFEHAAKTDDQKAKVEAAREQLSDSAALFVLPPEAGCEVTSADVQLHQEGNHNAFEASYAFTCSNTAILNALETRLFALYPAIEEIDVDYIAPSGQGSAELEPAAPVVTFPPAS
ncbi:MAG: DUF2796 domain-containing protein [Rhizobiaceae bacterium]